MTRAGIEAMLANNAADITQVLGSDGLAKIKQDTIKIFSAI